MSSKAKNKKKGVFRLVTGMLFGVLAAVSASFLGKKENRQKIVKTLKKYKNKK
jgi:hypothetical protein